MKRQVLAECAEPGASIAKVSTSHGLNANLVHEWRRQAQSGVEPVAAFVPVTLIEPSVASEPAKFDDLELRRGAISGRVRWPMAAIAARSAWLREILN